MYKGEYIFNHNPSGVFSMDNFPSILGVHILMDKTGSNVINNFLYFINPTPKIKIIYFNIYIPFFGCLGIDYHDVFHVIKYNMVGT